jgi:hypothetical protein
MPLFHLSCKKSNYPQIFQLNYFGRYSNQENYIVRRNKQQKESPHLDIIWLDVDEEEVPNNNTSRKPKAKSKETKNYADNTHLGFLSEPSDKRHISTKQT